MTRTFFAARCGCEGKVENRYYECKPKKEDDENQSN